MQKVLTVILVAFGLWMASTLLSPRPPEIKSATISMPPAEADVPVLTTASDIAPTQVCDCGRDAFVYFTRRDLAYWRCFTYHAPTPFALCSWFEPEPLPRSVAPFF